MVDPEALTSLQREVAELRESLPPIGAIMAWSGAEGSVPANWAVCDGSSIPGNASSTLNKVLQDWDVALHPSGKLPDLRGFFLRGASHGGEIDKGRKIGTPQQAETLKHAHDYRLKDGKAHRIGVGGGAINHGSTPFLYLWDDPVATGETMEAGGAETRPINRAAHWIIRVR